MLKLHLLKEAVDLEKKVLCKGGTSQTNFLLHFVTKEYSQLLQ